MRSAVRRLLRSLNRDLVYLTPEEKEDLERAPELSYRDLVIRQALHLKRGEVSLREAQFLGELVAGAQHTGPIVEIGTLFGSSTRAMLLRKTPEQKILSVDSYDWNPLNISKELHSSITAQILEEAERTCNLERVVSDKNVFFKSYDGPPPALVFLDAIHTYDETKKDIEWAKSVDAQIICGHDYDREKFPGVCQIVDEQGGPNKLVETLWVL